MRKLVFFFFLILLFFILRVENALAACQISAPNSADYNTQITVNVDQVPSPPTNQTPGLSVRDSGGNEIGCYPLSWPSATVVGVGLPSAGTHTTLRVEMRECTGALCYTCGQFISGPECTKTVNLTGTPPSSASCSVNLAPNQITVSAQNLDCANSRYCFSVINPNSFKESTQCKDWGTQCTGSITVSFIPQVSWGAGSYRVEVHSIQEAGPLATSCSFSYSGEPSEPSTAYDICQGEQKCIDCIDGKTLGVPGSWTAIGCLPTGNPQEFIAWLLGAAIGIAGGIAFLLMLWGGFQIITSTGDPEKLNKGKEILTSAIIGLIVIIFSLFLLQLIGVKILQIPGFGTP